jgi:RNA polymerase sigma-70 factor (ECF subfamily)
LAPTAPASAAADHSRLERLFVAHYRWIWRTLRRLGVPEAFVDDAAQQVFLVASNRLDTIDEAREPAFLLGAAVRIAANARRREARRREHADAEASSPANPIDDPEALLDWKQRREKLDEWLNVLSLELRLPFVLFELDGQSLAEVSALLELPLGTVKTRLRRARALFLEAARRGGHR